MTEYELLKFTGSRIREVREKKNLSQVELARRCGFGKASMSRIESGQINVTLFTLKKICDVLEVMPSKLVP